MTAEATEPRDPAPGDATPFPEAGMSSVEETELLRLAQAGHDEAFSEIVRRYQARLRAYTSQYIDTTSDVFELVQDAFLNTYRHLDRFDTARAFYPWLRTICNNLILNYFRARRSSRNVNLQLVDDALWERISSEEPAGDDLGAEQIESLRECLKRLAKSQRDLIYDRYHGGVAVKDIALSLRATAASVSMRLRRIRDRLRKCMDERMRRVT